MAGKAIAAARTAAAIGVRRSLISASVASIISQTMDDNACPHRQAHSTDRYDRQVRLSPQVVRLRLPRAATADFQGRRTLQAKVDARDLESGQPVHAKST